MKSNYFKDLTNAIKYDSKFVNGPVHAAWFIDHVTEYTTAINEVISTHFSSASISTSSQVAYTSGTMDATNNDIRSIKKLFSQKVLPNLYFSALMALKKNAADARSLTEIAKSLGTVGNVSNLPGMFRLITENRATLKNTNNIMHSFYEHPMCSNKEEMVIVHEDVTAFDPTSGVSISYPVYRPEVLKHILLQVSGDAEKESRLRSAFKPINDDTFGGREYELHTTEVETFDVLFPTTSSKVKNGHVTSDEYYFPYTKSAETDMANTIGDTKDDAIKFYACMDLDLHAELDRYKLKQVDHANIVFLPISSAKQLFPKQRFMIMPQLISKPDANYLSCYYIENITNKTSISNNQNVAIESTTSSIRLSFDSDLANKLGIKRKFKQINLVRGIDRLDTKYTLLFRSKYFFELPVISTLMTKDDSEKTLNKDLDTLINTSAVLNENAIKCSSMVPNYFGDIGFKNSGIINNLDVTLYNVNETYQGIDLGAIREGGKLLNFMSGIFNNDPSAKFGRSTQAKANMRVLEENFEAAVIQDISAYTMEGPLSLEFKRRHYIKKNNFRKTSSDITIPTQLAKDVNSTKTFKARQYANWVPPIAVEDAVYLPLGITGVTTDGNGFVKAVKVENTIAIKRLLQDTIITKEAQDHEFSFSIDGYIGDAVDNFTEGKTYLDRNASIKKEIGLKDVFVGVTTNFEFQKGSLGYDELNHMVITEREAASNFYDNEEGKAKVIVSSIQFNKVRKDIREYEQEGVIHYRFVAGRTASSSGVKYSTVDFLHKIANEVVMRNAVKCSTEDAPQDFDVIHLESNIFGAMNVIKANTNLLTLIEDFHYLFLSDAEIEQIANLRHSNRVVFKPDAVLESLKTTADNIQDRFETLYGKKADMIDKIVNNVDILNSQNLITQAIIKELEKEISPYDALEKVYILYCLTEASIARRDALDVVPDDDSNLDGSNSATKADDVIMGGDENGAIQVSPETMKIETTEASGAEGGKHVTGGSAEKPITNIAEKVDKDIDVMSDTDDKITAEDEDTNKLTDDHDNAKESKIIDKISNFFESEKPATNGKSKKKGKGGKNAGNGGATPPKAPGK